MLLALIVQDDDVNDFYTLRFAQSNMYTAALSKLASTGGGGRWALSVCSRSKTGEMKRKRTKKLTLVVGCCCRRRRSRLLLCDCYQLTRVLLRGWTGLVARALSLVSL